MNLFWICYIVATLLIMCAHLFYCIETKFNFEDSKQTDHSQFDE